LASALCGLAARRAADRRKLPAAHGPADPAGHDQRYALAIKAPAAGWLRLSSCDIEAPVLDNTALAWRATCDTVGTKADIDGFCGAAGS